jgi:uncharacterized protein with beta-barrel porin domain
MKYDKKLYFISLAIIAVLSLPATSLYARESDETPDQLKIGNNQESTTLKDDNSPDDNIVEEQDKNDRDQTSAEKIDEVTDQNDGNDEDNKDVAEEHRSSVASFVQNLLDLSDKSTSTTIGEQVREVAREQDDSEENVSKAIDAIKKRNKITTFFFGTDYKNVGQLRSEIAKTGNRIEKLSRLLEVIPTSTPSTSTIAEIANLKLEQIKLNTFITQNENVFSLFGWFVKLFNK